MKSYVPYCQFCGIRLSIGDMCEECHDMMSKICPLHRPICSAHCPYKKEGFCDYPFIWNSNVKAEPDKVTK